MNKELMLSNEQIAEVSGGVLIGVTEKQALKGTYEIVFISHENQIIILNKDLMKRLHGTLNSSLTFEKITEEDVKRSCTGFIESMVCKEVQVVQIYDDPKDVVVFTSGLTQVFP